MARGRERAGERARAPFGVSAFAEANEGFDREYFTFLCERAVSEVAAVLVGE
jgi:hypothetical protein